MPILWPVARMVKPLVLHAPEADSWIVFAAQKIGENGGWTDDG